MDLNVNVLYFGYINVVVLYMLYKYCKSIMTDQTSKLQSFTWERETTLLSSLIDSSTISLLGLFFCFRIAVAKSSFLDLQLELKQVAGHASLIMLLYI